MLIVSILCFIGFVITNADENSLKIIINEPAKNIGDLDSKDQIKTPGNISNMKIVLQDNSSITNETSFDVSITMPPLTTVMLSITNIQSMVNQLLAEKNYKSICSKNAEASVDLDYPYLKSNSDLDCSRKSFIFFSVLSHVANHEYRDKIRQSWGSIRQLQDKKITVIFYVYSDEAFTNDEKLAVEKENNEYLDTVLLMEHQGIRTKVRMYLKMFQLAIFGCNKADYFTFVNDSMFVNIPTLFEAILTHKDISKHDSNYRSLLLCKVKRNAMAIRSKKSVWFIPTSEWSEKQYPPYCDMEQGIVMSYDVLRDTLMCSFFAKKLFIADVFITGVLPQNLDIIREDFLEDFSTEVMKNHHTRGDITHNVFLTEGQKYNVNTWRLIFTRSLREI